MKNIWFVIIGIFLFSLVMILLTFSVPEIKTYAFGIASSKHLPLWLIGLFAPLAYLFQRIGQWIKSSDGSRVGVITGNKQLKEEQERIRRELDSLLDWRSRMLQQEYEAVSRLKTDISRMEAQLAGLGSQIRKIQNTSVEEISASMGDKEKDDVFERYLREHGASIYK